MSESKDLSTKLGDLKESLEKKVTEAIKAESERLFREAVAGGPFERLTRPHPLRNDPVAFARQYTWEREGGGTPPPPRPPYPTAEIRYTTVYMAKRLCVMCKEEFLEKPEAGWNDPSDALTVCPRCAAGNR